MKDFAPLAVRMGTTTRSGGTSSPSASLPPDLLAQSCRRVGIASLVTGSLWAFGLLMNSGVYRLIGSQNEVWAPAWKTVGEPAGVVGLVLSSAMFWAARRLSARPMLVIHLGLVYEVVCALLIALVTWWDPRIHGGRVSWVCVLILVYPSIAPSTPRNTLLASFAAATAEVLGFALAAARHVLPPDATPFALSWELIVPYICAILAVVPVKIIRKLGHQVSRARELGSYRLEERIGRGGMGEVYRASHRMLARPAAIKLIRPEMLGAGGPDARATILTRFRREADAAASLRSPHTIELFDFGITEDGTFYYVMEMLEGIDWETLVERHGPQPPERVVHIMHQACESLAEAHARGLVHRDVKPSNLFVCRLGLEVDFVKVLDFGLVKKENAAESGDVKLTTPQLTTGTPAFMAPEAALDPQSVDRRADVYALGCVAYWLLAGTLVFAGDAPMQILLQHVREIPVPPSRRSGRDLPAELDALVLACLEKRPEDRPQDAGELLRRLDALHLREAWSDARRQAWWTEKRPEAPQPVAEKSADWNATILQTSFEA